MPSSSPRLRRYSSPPRERARGVVSVAKDCASSPSEEGEEWEAGGGEVRGLGDWEKKPVANGGMCSMVALWLSSMVSGVQEVTNTGGCRGKITTCSLSLALS